MNRLLLLLIAIVVVASGAALADLNGLAARVPRSRYTAELPPQFASSTADTGWRRTTHGWEHESTWQQRSATESSPFRLVSPVIIGLLQLCTAAGALALFDKRSA